MTAYMLRSFELVCDEPDCRATFRGASGDDRAPVRKRAVRAGWTHVRSDSGRKYDKDYCLMHKPEAQS